MDKTREFIGSTFFRKRKFRYKFEELLDMLSGTSQSYIDLVLEDGRYSAKKTDALISELLQCLVELRAYRRISEDFTGGEMRYEKLSAGERSFYKSYFYLLLGLGMYSGEYQWSTGGSHEGGTWDALLDADDMLPQGLTMAELDRNIINASEELFGVGSARLRYPDGIFYRLLGAYEYVTGEYFSSMLTQKEYRAGYDLLTDFEKKIHDDPEYKRKLIDMENEELNNIEFSDEDLDWTPEKEYSPNELDEMDEDYLMAVGDSDFSDKITAWKTFFADEKRFKSSCRTVHKGLFGDAVHGDPAKEIPEVVEYYLSKNGYSAWMDDDRFFPVYTYLNKVYLASRKVLGRD